AHQTAILPMKHTHCPCPPPGRLCLAIAALWFTSVISLLAPVGTGTNKRRVLNPRTGKFLERAHIVIEGTSLETFTDADGYYRLSSVPVGTATMRTFFTGMSPQTGTVIVAADQIVKHDVNLQGFDARPGEMKDGEIVKLSQFVVGTSREMDGAARAINEQRFASNIMNVISSDEFGGVAEGNVAEVMKFLPGVT